MSERLNPIQQKIANGMSPLVAFFSEHTCGEACWEAREDICHCSCAGKNHGCMRDANGIRPERTAKIDGVRYVLKATCNNQRDEASQAARSEVYDKCLEICRQHNPEGKYRLWDTNVRNAPARIRNASKSQLAAWPELASYRALIAEVQSGSWCWDDVFRARPELLWVREDLQ